MDFVSAGKNTFVLQVIMIISKKAKASQVRVIEFPGDQWTTFYILGQVTWKDR